MERPVWDRVQQKPHTIYETGKKRKDEKGWEEGKSVQSYDKNISALCFCYSSDGSWMCARDGGGNKDWAGRVGKGYEKNQGWGDTASILAILSKWALPL